MTGDSAAAPWVLTPGLAASWPLKLRSILLRILQNIFFVLWPSAMNLGQIPVFKVLPTHIIFFFFTPIQAAAVEFVFGFGQPGIL